MRHLKAGRKLKRTASHRKATLATLSASLILHKKIRTTVAKAKETRISVEKLISRAKRAIVRETDGAAKDVAARREVFAVLRNRSAVSELFKEIAPKVLNRAGGYTRVVKLGRRLGDGAELAVLELVDFSVGTTATKKKKPVSKKANVAAGTELSAAPHEEPSATESSQPAEAKSVSDSQETKDSK